LTDVLDEETLLKVADMPSLGADAAEDFWAGALGAAFDNMLLIEFAMFYHLSILIDFRAQKLA
jgi:hypothetical protein